MAGHTARNIPTVKTLSSTTSDFAPSQNFIWQPNLSFFRSGAHIFVDPSTGEESPISWELEKIPLRGFSFNFCRCRMQGFGYEGKGYGIQMLLKNSMIQSFAEAWERLWGFKTAQAEPLLSEKISSSNGFASGKTSHDALATSRNELIERSVYGEAWSRMKGWVRYDLRSAAGKMLSRFLQIKGWKVQTFLICEKNLGNVLACLIQNPKKGAFFDTVFVGEQGSKNLEAKLLKGLSKCIFKMSEADALETDQLPYEGKPYDHIRYYTNPKNLRAFGFLDQIGYDPDFITLSSSDDIRSTLLVPVTDFPAVAVSWHPEWPELKWGTQTIRGKNPWLHPLA